MKNFFRDFQPGAARRDRAARPQAKASDYFEQATLGFTPDAPTLPAATSRKVAHYK
jgi:hypothetical protein